MTDSSDDEFYDAIGDAAQMEEVRAKFNQAGRFSDSSKPNIQNHQKFHVETIHQTTNHQAVRRPNFEENEITLAISEKEIKDLRDQTSSSRNLQQILDKFDETSISHEQATKLNGSKEGEIDLPFQVSPISSVVKTNPKQPPASISKFCKASENEVKDKSQSDSEKSVNSARNSTGSPTKGKGNRSFMSILKKQSKDAEFSREHIKQHNKSSSNFDKLLCLQTVEDEKRTQQQETPTNSKKTKSISPTWIAKFSPDYKFLATGGSDGIVRVYRVKIMQEEEPDRDSMNGLQILDPDYISLVGHKSDIIDISWYKNSNFVISSGIDKNVILWDVEQQTLMKIFEHSDIVSCISFHPLVDEFFATGCLDKMIRIWDINETKVVDWVQTNDMITAMTFSPDKNHLLVGFYKGTVKIYRTDQGKLKFTMEVVCKNSFVWGKLNKVGKKVTGILFTEDDEFLVMTNDSRMRLIDMKTYETKMKYKGHTSGKYHIQPSYNYEKELILCGSEDEKVYIWDKFATYVPQINPIYSLQKANRNTSYEFFKPFPKYNTTCAIWVPFPALQKYKEKMASLWRDIYVDNLMILFSSDSRIKVLGNLIELDPPTPKKH